jgi:hypothetical protein
MKQTFMDPGCQRYLCPRSSANDVDIPMKKIWEIYGRVIRTFGPGFLSDSPGCTWSLYLHMCSLVYLQVYGRARLAVIWNINSFAITSLVRLVPPQMQKCTFFKHFKSPVVQTRTTLDQKASTYISLLSGLLLENSHTQARFQRNQRCPEPWIACNDNVFSRWYETQCNVLLSIHGRDRDISY